MTAARPAGAAAALGYLTLPVLLFWWCYVGGPIGAVLGAGALSSLCGVLFGLRRADAAVPPPPTGVRRAVWVGALLLLAAAVLLATGFPDGPFVSDWFKHWALLGLLADQAWPVRVELQGQSYGLRFYLAAYMVPAALAKAPLGLPLALATLLWLGLGYALVFRMVALRQPTAATAWARVAAMLLFLLMAGADSAAEYTLRALAGQPLAPGIGFHHEWWALDWLGQPFQYSSVLTALSWVPHQSIATVLVALMLCDDSEPTAWAGALGMGLLALWSPLGMMGLMPLLMWRLARCRASWLRAPRGRLAAAGLCLALLPLVLATARYLASELPSTGLSWPSAAQWQERLPAGLIFCLVELAPCLLILGWWRLREPVLTISLATLVVLPWFGGTPPDFVMRASMGPLAVLAWRAAQVLGTWQLGAGSSTWPRRTAMLGLLLASLTSLNEAVYQLQGGTAHAQQPAGDPLRKSYLLDFAQSSTITVPEFFDACGWRYLPQYFAHRPAWVEP